ncbi:hypothetical protein E4T39_02937 [Aureobasidium subglaciale]|nr:hypothetical protein E4T39_02937 [Aureobasidium subglaciale]
MASNDPAPLILAPVFLLWVLYHISPRAFHCLFIALGLVMAKLDDITSKDLFRYCVRDKNADAGKGCIYGGGVMVVKVLVLTFAVMGGLAEVHGILDKIREKDVEKGKEIGGEKSVKASMSSTMDKK